MLETNREFMNSLVRRRLDNRVLICTSEPKNRIINIRRALSRGRNSRDSSAEPVNEKPRNATSALGAHHGKDTHKEKNSIKMMTVGIFSPMTDPSS